MINFALTLFLFIPLAWSAPGQICETEECRAELRRLNQVVKDSGVRSGGLSSFDGVMGGLGLIPPKKTVFSIEGMSAYQGDPTVIQQGKATLVSPMWIKDHQSLTASLNAGTVKINEPVVAPDGTKIRELHRIEAGGQYTKSLEENRMWGLRGSLGSAGDKPFETGKEYTFNLNGFYAKPGKSDSYWVYSFFLSNNNPVLNYVPIPGIIYFTRKENFTGMFGFPIMSMQWTPLKKTSVSVSYFITNFRTTIAYSVADKHQASVGFAINKQTYLREGRKDNTDRLFFNDKRIYAGWRSVLSENLIAELQFGQSFDRAVHEGKRFNEWDWKQKLGRSWYASSAMTLSF